VDPVKTGLVGYGLGGRHFDAPLVAAADVREVARTSRQRRTTVPPGAEQ
jgi:hypothetical protein